MGMLSTHLEQTLHRAMSCSREFGHEYCTLEHLLLSLTDDPDAYDVIKACHGDVTEIRQKTAVFLADMDVIAVSLPHDPKPTLAFQRVVQRAIIHAQSSGKAKVTGANLLISMFAERESSAIFFLQEHGVKRLDVMNYVAHGVTPDNQSPPVLDDDPLTITPSTSGKTRTKQPQKSPLETWCVNLNEQAKKGQIDNLIGREQELHRTIEILARRSKNNPLYIGDAGVGKTAIAEGLALKIYEGNVPHVLKDAVIFALDMGTMVAGTRYRGDFEERMRQVLKDVETREAKGQKIVLFIDEIHTLVGAGASASGTLDASNLLKPALARGRLHCIGATTFHEYKNHFAKDKALARRFQKVEVAEPSPQDALKILEGLKPVYEAFHGVKFHENALKTAVELSHRHIHDRYLPDKAIDVMDEAAAKVRIQNQDEKGSSPAEVDDKMVEKVIAAMAKIPEKSVNSNDKKTLKNLERDLKTLVFGQSDAILALSQSIRIQRAGLREANKAIGCYLFAGPTGVGKTEVARQLAHTLGIGLIRFDMSEYMERHAVSRLIGTPPGYVGFDQGGLLTDAVVKTPHAVLLLDEIEKAHGDILNLLLQVMDNGMLTDHNGKQISFQNIILIMTSNAGAADMEKGPMGFNPQKNNVVDDTMDDGAIKRIFSPEFRNRLDRIVYFKALSLTAMRHIVDKMALELETLLAPQQVTLTLDKAVKAWLLDKGFDPVFGARPLKRLVETKIKPKLAEELLFGKLDKGGHVAITMDGDDISIFIQKAKVTA